MMCGIHKTSTETHYTFNDYWQAFDKKIPETPIDRNFNQKEIKRTNNYILHMIYSYPFKNMWELYDFVHYIHLKSFYLKQYKN